MMFKNIYILYIIICIAFLHACVKDNSTDEPQDINEVQINGLKDTITVSMGDLLDLKPQLRSPHTSTRGYDYVWYAYTANQQHAADTLSQDKDLLKEITMVPGTYTLVFRITDRQTNVFYKHTSTVIVVNDYTPGLMILGETNGIADVHFINTANNKFFENVYQSSNNNAALGKNPVSISYYPKVYQMPAEVLILCQDHHGGVFADPITFERTRDVRNSFYVSLPGSSVLNMTRYVEKNNNIQDYLIIDGLPYNRAVNSGDLLFKPAMLGQFYLSPIVFNQLSSRPAFYDIQGRRFLAHNNTMGALNTFLTRTNTNIIDPNNVGLDVLYAGAVSENEFFGLFKTPDQQEYHILRMTINSLRLEFSATEKYSMQGVDIDRATSFASSAALANYLFYVVDSKCYVYNVLSKSGGLLFDMGSNYEINLIKMDGAELKVAFINKASSSKKAGFATYDITTQGGIKANQSRVMQGLFDHIVDITNKD